MCSVSQFSQICRICAKGGDLYSVFSHSNICYSDMLMAVTGVQIVKDDGLPTHICVKCIELLESAYIFRQKAQETDAKLKSLQDIKTETFIVVKEESIGGTNSVKNECMPEEVEYLETVPKEENKHKKFTKRCGKPKTRYDFKKHKKNTATNLECNICRKSFKYLHKLQNHMRSHTKEKPYVCQLCGAAFSLVSNLSRHKKTHTGEKPHKCDVCSKGFIRSTSLVLHQRIHTGERPFACLLCEKAFCNREVLNIHVRTHNRNRDQISELIGPHELNLHLSSSSEPIETLFSCNLCSRSFVTQATLKAHYLTHGDKNFLCSYCGKSFTTKIALDSHVKIHTGAKPYTCSICAKSFSHFGSLQEHTRIHTGERPFVCDFCNKTFVQAHHLQCHVRVHTGEKPYKCTICNKQFSLNGTLTVHMRIHTGEKPYVCSVCDKGFYHSSTMKKHRARHQVQETTSEVKEEK